VIVTWSADFSPFRTCGVEIRNGLASGPASASYGAAEGSASYLGGVSRAEAPRMGIHTPLARRKTRAWAGSPDLESLDGGTSRDLGDGLR
jgi:hypothetical protein